MVPWSGIPNRLQPATIVCCNLRVIDAMRRLALPLAGMILLAGCGQQQPDRETGGAATGASTGAVIGLVGGPVGVVAGALIGAGAGAATGAAVGPEHLNLGPPPWSDTQHTQRAADASP